jgi:hypothetical protein
MLWVRRKKNVIENFFFFFFFLSDKEILLTANWSYNLNQAFIDNYNHDPELTWQYFCSQTGLYRVWPGHKWEYPEDDTDKLDLFDCRVQNWYIRATSSPRDVIILLDASGSMTGLKRSIASQTVETILDTLSDDDFVQIIKVNKQTRSFLLRNKDFVLYFSFKRKLNLLMIVFKLDLFKQQSRIDM